jgi:hypothetical protein
MVRSTDDEPNFIHDKNDGYCWHCGKIPAFANYGGFTDDSCARSAWEVDQRASCSRGTECLGNFVPAFVQCNQSNGDLISRKFTGWGIR